MIRLTDDRLRVGGIVLGAIWIGNSAAGHDKGNIVASSIGAILNVAQDLTGTLCWDDGIESMHVGLIDGPGNELTAYYAAVLALHALLKKHNVLMCCHTGSRSMAVALMYSAITSKLGWDQQLQMLRERVDIDLPTPNDAHREAFSLLSWKLLEKATA